MTTEIAGQRPTIILVWQDGEVSVDGPNQSSSPLEAYLLAYNMGTASPEDIPVEAYAVRPAENTHQRIPAPEFFSPFTLEPIKITYTDRDTTSDDWIYISYRISYRSDDKLISNYTIRLDGRA
jgi:hypothetical protein